MIHLIIFQRWIILTIVGNNLGNANKYINVYYNEEKIYTSYYWAFWEILINNSELSLFNRLYGSSIEGFNGFLKYVGMYSAPFNIADIKLSKTYK